MKTRAIRSLGADGSFWNTSPREQISAPLQAVLLGHKPNAGGLSAKKRRDFFGKFLSKSKLRGFK